MLAVETYGQDVYVASVCLEANYAQVMKAFAEAEAHKGVSLIVAYAPCVMQVGGSPWRGLVFAEAACIVRGVCLCARCFVCVALVLLQTTADANMQLLS